MGLRRCRVKPNAPPNPRRNFDSAVEVAVWATKPGEGDYIFNRHAGQCPNFFTVPLVSSEVRMAYPHPTAKSVLLASRILEVLTLPGQVVVDPFCGSGALLEAALMLDRIAIGCDNDPKYVEMTRFRLHKREQEMAAQAAQGLSEEQEMTA
jgi:hypothetical protein